MDHKAYSLQEAYAKVGGMGKFQIYASVILIMGFFSGSFIVSVLQFLTLQPKFECSTDPSFLNPAPTTCHPHTHEGVPGFCHNDAIFNRVNTSDSTYLHNWFEQLDLKCKPKSQIGLIGSI